MVFERKRSEVVVSYLSIYENIVIKTAFSGSGVTNYEPATSETGTPGKHLFGNLARFHSATWQESIPIILPLRDGLKEPRHDGMELHGADTGNAFRLGQGFRPD